MAINFLRGRAAGAKRKNDTPPVSIGEPDAHVFNCPRCSRPLSDGTPRCPGCGTRLILGVTIRRASILMGFGLIVGVFLGAAVASGVITGLVNSAATAVSSTVSTPTPSPTPTASPTPEPTPVPTPVPTTGPPAAAVSALTQTTLLDARIAADAGSLHDTLASGGSASDIARVLRALASDAANGSAQVARLRDWSQAGTVADLRDAFYGAVSKAALDALQATLTNQKAYTSAGKAMLKTLAGVVALDSASRELATQVAVTLPVVDFGVLAAK